MSSCKEQNYEGCLLSKRGHRFINMEKPMAIAVYSELAQNSYDSEKNPQGAINLATCDNKIVGDLIVDKLSHYKIEEQDTHYFCFIGSVRFRKTIARFFQHYMKPAETISFENIVVSNGAASLGHSLASVLCDPGDAILIPTPYYYGFTADFTLQAEVLCYPVNLSSQADQDGTNPYQLSVSELEAALKKAKQENVRIRAMVLCNPHNPLGRIYSKELVKNCLEFAQRHSLHVISDEIYMLSIDKCCPWTSASSFKKVIDPNLLHIMWGCSKDFGLSGFRVGVLFSRNAGVVQALNAISCYHAVPPLIQNTLEGLISDQAWLDSVYIPAFHERLRNCRAIISEELRRMNVRIITPNAGLFMWANFSHYMQPSSFETEKMLTTLFSEHGILLSPGSIFASTEPGWFRVVVSSDPAILQIAIERIKSALAAFPERLKASKNQVISAFSSDEGASLEDLVSQLKVEIGKSDWLKENTAEKWITENPQLAKEFMDGRGSST